jgi:hypothetical protein
MKSHEAEVWMLRYRRHAQPPKDPTTMRTMITKKHHRSQPVAKLMRRSSIKTTTETQSGERLIKV